MPCPFVASKRPPLWCLALLQNRLPITAVFGSTAFFQARPATAGPAQSRGWEASSVQRLSPPTSLSWDLEGQEGEGPLQDCPMVARTYLGRFRSRGAKTPPQLKPEASWPRLTKVGQDHLPGFVRYA